MGKYRIYILDLQYLLDFKHLAYCLKLMDIFKNWIEFFIKINILKIEENHLFSFLKNIFNMQLIFDALDQLRESKLIYESTLKEF